MSNTPSLSLMGLDILCKLPNKITNQPYNPYSHAGDSLNIKSQAQKKN